MVENDKQTEKKIFEAATEVFMEKGMDGARMQDIANRAGINKSLLHYYYRTKDRLFNEVFEMIFGHMLKKFAPVFDADLTLEEKIRFFFREHITFLQKNPRLASFVLHEINRNPERVRNFIGRIDIGRLWTDIEAQHKDELKKSNIRREDIPQLMTSIAAMSVFPFAARVLVKSILEKMGYDFDDYIEKRKEYAAEFVIGAIRKEKGIREKA
ncbi:MAG: TetR/AcrR family transcriptional regulator [Bacteroidales bacterium]|nr:TetR/AcrR family transcriptional regulator [Bacteroidales bacterium]MBN2763598.1 TetR/AcrR family transcriptional regulator [Bacteroidales bacterium]